MKREVSVYLDLIRFTAALAVLGEHSSDYFGGWIWRFADFGGEAVGVFFVLSGFVISYVTANRESDASSYTIARATRMYSVVIPAMAVTFLLDTTGKHFDLTVYSSAIYVDGGVLDYLRSLTFTNQLWFSETHVGTMGPYWSLGYEVPYYAIFGVFVFVTRRYLLNVLAAAALLLLAGPRIACYFPLWLMGVGCQRLMRHIEPSGDRRWTRHALWLGSLIATIVLIVAWREITHTHADHRIKIGAPYDFAIGNYLPVVYFYGLGILLSAHLLTVSALAGTWLTAPLRLLEKPIRWLAGGTFSLYLLNLPVVLCVRSILGPTVTPLKTTLIIALALALSFAFAAAFERRKSLWHSTLSRLLGRLGPQVHDS